MKLKGKTICNKTTGEELGVVTKAGSKFCYIGDDKFPRADVVIVKRRKKARKGKAPDEKTQIKRDRKAEAEMENKWSGKDLDIPAFLQREDTPERVTDKFQLKVHGTRTAKSKMWITDIREFDKIKDARAYLMGLDPSFIDIAKNDRGAKLPWGTTVWCNYSLKKIMALRKPKKKLPNIIWDHERKSSSDRVQTDYSKYYDQEDSNMATSKDKKKSKTKSSGKEMVVLKKLCQELDLDPRKARQKLRSTVGQTDGRWEWPAGSKELDKVKKILSGKDESKKSKKKKKAKEEKPEKKDKKKKKAGSKKKSKK